MLMVVKLWDNIERCFFVEIYFLILYNLSMKKIILFLILLLICGCHKEEKNISELPNTNEIEEIEEIKEPVYIDDNPIKIGFYKKENGVYIRNKKDIN